MKQRPWQPEDDYICDSSEVSFATRAGPVSQGLPQCDWEFISKISPSRKVSFLYTFSPTRMLAELVFPPTSGFSIAHLLKRTFLSTTIKKREEKSCGPLMVIWEQHWALNPIHAHQFFPPQTPFYHQWFSSVLPVRTYSRPSWEICSASSAHGILFLLDGLETAPFCTR